MPRFIVSIVIGTEDTYPLAPVEAETAIHAFIAIGFRLEQAQRFTANSDAQPTSFRRREYYSDTMPDGPLAELGSKAWIQLTEELPHIRNPADLVKIALDALSQK